MRVFAGLCKILRFGVRLLRWVGVCLVGFDEELWILGKEGAEACPTAFSFWLGTRVPLAAVPV